MVIYYLLLYKYNLGEKWIDNWIKISYKTCVK